MPRYRVQVTRENANTNPSDVVSNTFYIDKTTIPGQGSADLDALATDTKNIWQARLPPIADYPKTRVRIYDMADPKPRPVLAESQSSIVGGSDSGPQEVALCLSFYSGRNLPRRRGRLYFGPYFSGGMAGRPSSSQQTALLNIATDLAALGGADVAWVIYSPTDNQYRGVTNAWVDNAWDTQRSRGLAPTARQTRATGD
jgi:hypothetical protein